MRRFTVKILLIMGMVFILCGCGSKQTGNTVNGEAGETGSETVQAENTDETEEDRNTEKDVESINAENASAQNSDAENMNAEDTEDAGTENADTESADLGEEQTTDADTSAESSPDGNTTQNGAALSLENGTPYEIHGALHVDGTVMKDQNGQAYVLRGVSTHGLSWFPEYANKEAFRTMRDEWGIQVVRLAVYTDEYNGYCTGDESNRNRLKQKIYDSVQAATELGLYVIVDWHVLNDRNPNVYKDQAVSFFTEVTDHLKNYQNIIYEICNEPNGSTSWSEVKAYAQEIIPVIRKNAPNAIIIVGTPTWSQDVDKAAADPIKGYDNIMYALHFYADTHRDDLRKKLEGALQKGLPVFVSEFGICDASGSGAINEQQAEIWMNLMDSYGISFCIWNLSNKNETSALIRSDCTKVSGWGYEELSASGQWFVNYMRKQHPAPGSLPIGMTGDGNDTDSHADDYADNHMNTGNDPASGNTSTDASGNGISIHADITNSWEADGKYFYQCNITLENTGSRNINGWNCAISADCALEISQGWCGCFSLDSSGKKILITPESYNATIECGTSRSDIGVIFCTKQKLQSIQAEVSGN